MTQARGRRRGWALVLVVSAVFGLDSLLFRTGLYTSLLEPDSSTGLFEMILRREQQAQWRYGDNLVVTVGHSRFAWSPKVLDHLPVRPAYELRDAGMAGTDARTWYYMLRDLDPTARRYRAIVIGVDDYDDEDRAFEPDNDIRALHYVLVRLRWSDVWNFSRSFRDPSLQLEALRGGLLKGIVLQRDIQAFLSNPWKRIEYVRLCNQSWPNWIYDYTAPTRNLVGLEINWPTLQVTFPPGVDDNQRDTVDNFLAHKPDPQTGRLYAFHREWYGRIVNRYRGSRTKIIFIRLARGPIPRPDNLVQKQFSSIRELARQPNVLLADEHAFDSLEHPEFYWDGMHLNRAGIERFSVMLADEIAKLLGPPDRNEVKR